MSARSALLAVGVLLSVSNSCRPSSGVVGTVSYKVPPGVELPAGLKMRVAPVLVALEEDRSFRWVAPESLVQGVTSEDIASAETYLVRGLRESVETVFLAHGWRVVPDSSDYEVAVFLAARTELRTETRQEPAITATMDLPRCDASRGQREGRNCTNTPVRSRDVTVTVPATVRRAFHVVRRRSDGAVRVWVNPAENIEAVDATVARDLLRLFLSRDPG